jgi:hypothetical protein
MRQGRLPFQTKKIVPLKDCEPEVEFILMLRDAVADRIVQQAYRLDDRAR